MDNKEYEMHKCMELTMREKEILKFIYYGKTNRQIAQIMHLSPHTIKFYVTSILKKLGVNFRIQAVVKAISEKLLEE